MPAKRPTTIWQKISQAVRNDPKKAGVLTVLLVILGTLWVRMAMNGKQGPSQAVASSPMTNKESTAHVTGGAVPSLDAATSLRNWMDATIEPVSRNLFAVSLEQFPQDINRPAHSSVADPQGFWDDLAKSMTSRADVRRERQTLLENLQQLAGRMHLQSTMMGAKPKAVIDGELVGEGGVVATRSGESRIEFRVLKIEARRVFLEREGIKLEILMK